MPTRSSRPEGREPVADLGAASRPSFTERAHDAAPLRRGAVPGSGPRRDRRLARPAGGAPGGRTAIAVLADAWFPAPWPRLNALAPAPTIDLTIHFRVPLPLPDTLLLGRFAIGSSATGSSTRTASSGRPTGRWSPSRASSRCSSWASARLSRTPAPSGRELLDPSLRLLMPPRRLLRRSGRPPTGTGRRAPPRARAARPRPARSRARACSRPQWLGVGRAAPAFALPASGRDRAPCRRPRLVVVGLMGGAVLRPAARIVTEPRVLEGERAGPDRFEQGAVMRDEEQRAHVRRARPRAPRGSRRRGGSSARPGSAGSRSSRPGSRGPGAEPRRPTEP